MEVTKKIPTLRFPGFEGEWEEKALASICNIQKGEQLNKNLLTPTGRYYALNGGVEPSGYTDKYNCTAHTISISEGGNSCGYVNYNKGNFWSGGHCYTLEDLKNFTCVSFLFQSLKYNQEKIMNLRVGTGLPNIQKTALSKFKVQIPPLPEQEKIAACLTAMDEKIEGQQRKVEHLQAYKKGLLQQLFSQTLRFPGFVDEWEEKKLGALIQILSNKNKESSVSLVLSVSNSKGFILQSEQFEDRNVASSDISGYKIVKKGEFAFNPARINVGSIAKLNNFNEGVVSPMYICFKTKPDKLNPEFLDSFIKTYKFNLEVKGKLEGSVRQTLSADGLNLVKLHLPTLPEQQKIADYISTLDEIITLEQQKLEKLQVYKKGLLQQLFV